jgi:hypothetical protein
MKFNSLHTLTLAASILAITSLPTGAFLPSSRKPLPDIDRRGEPLASVPEAQKAAAAIVQGRVPGAQVDFDRVTGAPKFIASSDGFLTGPEGVGRAVSSPTAAALTDITNAPTRAFLSEHRSLFGFGPEALDQAIVQRDYVAANNGLHTVVWAQQVNGIELFEALLISHTTKKGELVNISSQFIPDPAGAATEQAAHRSIESVKAVVLAAANIGEDIPVEKISTISGIEPRLNERQQFKAPGLKGPVDVKLVWLPMNQNQMRLCWEVVLMSRSRGEMFLVLVDVQNGETLLRHCLTAYLSDASYRVYTSDSPSPFSPGLSTPGSFQPPYVSRTLVTLSALDTNASPAGWIDDGGNETRGNNVDAHTDKDNNNVPDLPRPQGSPARVFDFAMDLTTQDPNTYSQAAIVQLFYLNNWMHDRLYQLGFTEAAGNFQSNNFGRGGVIGNDAVQADAQDGSGTDNANFSTPTDGSAGRMQMYIFTGQTPRRDGDLDAEVVLHEYSHGLSNRRVGGGVGISALQTRGMGEGWSDFFAMSLLSEEPDDVNACYATGGYVTYLLGPSFTQNYYFGIRRYPYSTDMTKNPLTFKDIDPGQISSHAGVPISTVVGGGGASEVHNQGEVWCVTLWEARAKFVTKYGWAVGNQRIMQLVIDGMGLSPANPTFLQARDGILQADLVNHGGADRNELWAAFAKRGMGFSATSPANSTTAGLVESFDVPDSLRVTPTGGFVAKGPIGGPFTNSINYVLTNSGAASFNWSLINTSLWLTVSSTNGSLTPGGAAAAVTASVNSSANGLPMGIYSATAIFSNETSHIVQTRSFSLFVGQVDYFTELFNGTSKTNDLSFRSLTFTPNGSSSFYAACSDPATNFPTDPTGGTTVTLGDDANVQVTLSGTNKVGLYGQKASAFYIGSNGYLTWNGPDTQWTESLVNHFSMPRVSALFDDLAPNTGGTVSWKQLSDRVAVTYSAVPEYSAPTSTNSFQIELFFDGRVRITYLRIKALDGLAGLSAGAGVPADYAEGDLSSSYGSCAVAPASFLTGTSKRLAGGQFQSMLAGPAANYEIQSSSDFSNWSVLQSISMTNGIGTILDTNASSLLRFYRARQLP